MDIIFKILRDEIKRQNETLEMIASENYIPDIILKYYGNVFANKYSEGEIGNRYYGGQENVDKIEAICKLRGLAIFDLIEYNKEIEKKIYKNPINYKEYIKEWDINVQALSGTQANIAVYLSILDKNDTILSLDLKDGGHLSHGSKLNLSGKFYNIIHYKVDTIRQEIDKNDILEKALKFKPKLIIAGYSSYRKDIDYEFFYEIKKKLKEIGHDCLLMADISHIAGLIVGKVLSNKLWQYFDIVTTTTHKTLRGPRGALIYFRKNLNINKGVFPGIQGGPHVNQIFVKALALGLILKNKKNREKYAKKIIDSAKLIAEILKKKGRKVIGTENHIILIDVTSKNLTGKQAQDILEKIGISVNKNLIPGDVRSAFDPSGIRIGTAALVTRGLKKHDFIKIANIIDEALTERKSLKKLKEEVKKIAKKYPLKYS